MLKTLWNSLNSPKASESREAVAFNRGKLKMLAEYFPIGKKLRYYPEYQREIVFHTIILAYRVNNHFLYSRDEVLLDREGFPTGFQIAGKKVLPLEKLERFQLLVPDTTDKEMTLDYITRAELGRGGQFRVGNAITLVIETDERTIPTVDTVVDRRQIMTAGPYADSSTILVTPDFDSLILADKRQKQRVETAIRADLYLAADALPFLCVLEDFSERSLRLRLSDASRDMPPMEPEDQVVIEFDLGEAATTCRFRGKVFRRADDFCVIQIEHLYKSGDFEKVNMMDIIEIKAGLLNLRS
ncbi:MAG: hypothetical protein Q8O34_11615 [Rhodocyclaceae bacterium]|nr:hypothetical protein [Rhodocyclaceae bacterium]